MTRNYLQDDVGLIGPWTSRNNGPFAYRIQRFTAGNEDPSNQRDRPARLRVGYPGLVAPRRFFNSGLTQDLAPAAENDATIKILQKNA